MENRPDLDDDDDDFSDIYKAYTGPLGTSAANAQEKPKVNNKRSQASSDEDEERDPNAVPTGFISRDAKVWEAKSKATERNWKKRKEEEMICKICGDPGHFTQGCPSTLGGRRNSQDFFERVAARDPEVRALFTTKVIEGIERGNGCKIKMDEKFIIVSGKDRLILRKGVDAVHKVINDECNDRNSPNSYKGRSRPPERSSPIGNVFSRSESLRARSIERSPIDNRLSRSESQRSNLSPRNQSQFHQRFAIQDKSVEDNIRGDLQKSSRNSPQARAYGSGDGGRGRSSLSRSPARSLYGGSSYSTFEGAYRSQGWETERRGTDVHADGKYDHPSLPDTLEGLELEYEREAMDLARLRDQQEDEENLKHREAIRELRGNYMKKLVDLRGSHAKHWDEFLHLDAQRRQQQVHQQPMSDSRFGGYQPSSLSDYDTLHNQPPYPGSNFHMEPRGRGQYTNPGENYLHSRPPARDSYSDFQHQRLDGYGRAYNRY